MAGRILNRRELREQADQAERAAAERDPAAAGAKAPPKGGKARPPASPGARKPRPKKAPVRMCARWVRTPGGGAAPSGLPLLHPQGGA
jgi:hypothetical protein